MRPKGSVCVDWHKICPGNPVYIKHKPLRSKLDHPTVTLALAFVTGITFDLTSSKRTTNLREMARIGQIAPSPVLGL